MEIGVLKNYYDIINLITTFEAFFKTLKILTKW